MPRQRQVDTREALTRLTANLQRHGITENELSRFDNYRKKLIFIDSQ